ncbi:hypothetical protein BSKO_13895 [Bryopsis sp. KO-2023]|nr:hypothetical protein BSKO_13895 [Bryopsis sp. KO-2023]
MSDSLSRSKPKAAHASSQQQLKGEDVVFIHDHLEKLHSTPDKMCNWSLYCVCDGHGGVAAAQFLKERMSADLVKRLPLGNPPEVMKRDDPWLEAVRMALITSFMWMDEEFEKEGLPPSIGSTVTVALLSGWLLTIANIGDSECFLDVGNRREYELTTSHKIDTNKGEQNRLKDVGKTVRPLSQDLFQPAEDDEQGVGPLRVWPCGLAVSRSIGDYDCGCEITAAPHVRQVEVPMSGARMIMASDGLWDHITGRRAMRAARKMTLKECPKELIELADSRSGDGLTDDTTVLIVDFVPKAGLDWRDACKTMRRPVNVLKRFRERMRGDSRSVIPRRVADYDGVRHCHCAYLGEAAASKLSLEVKRSEELGHQKKHESDRTAALMGLAMSENEMEVGGEADTDSDEDPADVDLKRRKEKLAATSSHLGLTRAQVAAAQATRRTLAPVADTADFTPSW